jgi:glucuronokinase
MVDTARSIGASATFTGSGGAIVGAYENERMFTELRKTLRKLNITVIKPEIVPGTGNAKV